MCARLSKKEPLFTRGFRSHHSWCDFIPCSTCTTLRMDLDAVTAHVYTNKTRLPCLHGNSQQHNYESQTKNHCILYLCIRPDIYLYWLTGRKTASYVSIYRRLMSSLWCLRVLTPFSFLTLWTRVWMHRYYLYSGIMCHSGMYGIV